MRGGAVLCSLALWAGCSFDASGIGGGDSGTVADASSAPRPPDGAEAPDAAPDVPVPVHLYTFNDGTADDAAGGADGIAREDLRIEGGEAIFEGDEDGGFVELPSGSIGISDYEELSLEAWFRFEEEVDWQRVFEFGAISDDDDSLGARNLFFTPTSSFSDARAVVSNADPGLSSEARAIAPAPLAAEESHHVVVTLDDEAIRLYLDGALVAVTPYEDAEEEPAPSIDQIDESLAYLGRSLYSVDELLSGAIDEFAIYDVALATDEVQERYEAGPAE
jgi:hypothetical protein